MPDGFFGRSSAKSSKWLPHVVTSTEAGHTVQDTNSDTFELEYPNNAFWQVCVSQFLTIYKCCIQDSLFFAIS